MDGEANAALIGFLAKLFGIPKRLVSLEHGDAGRQKRFFLPGITQETAEKVLLTAYPKAAKGKENM